MAKALLKQPLESWLARGLCFFKRVPLFTVLLLCTTLTASPPLTTGISQCSKVCNKLRLCGTTRSMVAALSLFAARKHQHLLRPYPHAVYIEESQVKEHQSSTTYLKIAHSRPHYMISYFQLHVSETQSGWSYIFIHCTTLKWWHLCSFRPISIWHSFSDSAFCLFHRFILVFQPWMASFTSHAIIFLWTVENCQIGIQHLESPGCETDGWFSNYFWSSLVKQLELNSESLCFNHMLFVWFKIFSGGLQRQS